MSGEPQLFRIDSVNHQSERIEEVDFARLGFRERRDIQEWVAANPEILDNDLLIINKEFSGFDRTDERLDLLAVDREGKLVVIELKRDDSGTDAHWQAIKYASYFQRATADDVVGMAAEYWGESQGDAMIRLLQHLDADDLNDLNNDQRIILASHRFAPEVTSAALWLNRKLSGEENMVTCIKLTPHQDNHTGALYVQASTIIPVPGVEEYVVSVGHSQQGEIKRSKNNFAVNLQKAYDRNKDDEVTHFLRQVGQLATAGLPDGIRPDKISRWGGRHWWGARYYHFWYRRPPWSNWGLSYQIDLRPQDESGQWLANTFFGYRGDIAHLLEGIDVHHDQHIEETWIEVNVGPDILNDEFAENIAVVVRSFIERITPIIDDFGNESSEADEL